SSSFTRTYPAHSITMIELTAEGTGGSEDPEDDGYTFCANEFSNCSFTGTASVAFGANGNYVYSTFTDGTLCTVSVFGSDPAFGTPKKCYYKLTGSGTTIPLLNAGFEAPYTSNYTMGPTTG